jgi:hypothetical protein
MSHGIELTGLLPGMYFFKATSGSLAYPPSAISPAYFFATRTFPRPDFDEDGDVDLQDFACLQRCFSGTGVAQTDPECVKARLDDDDDVDTDDFDLFMMCVNGAMVLPPPPSLCDP